MQVYFNWNSQFCGSCSDIREVPSYYNRKEIEDMFEEVLGVPFNEDCYYKILDEPTYEIPEKELLYLLSLKISIETDYDYADIKDMVKNNEDEAKELIKKEYRSKIIP